MLIFEEKLVTSHAERASSHATRHNLSKLSSALAARSVADKKSAKRQSSIVKADSNEKIRIPGRYRPVPNNKGKWYVIC